MSDEFSRDYFQPTVNKYLSTVLCIDDQFEDDISLSQKLTSPPAGSPAFFDTMEHDKHIVKLNKIISEFSKKGLLITPINPRLFNEDECSSIVHSLALKSDAIILDWKITIKNSEDDTAFSATLIKELLKDNRYHLIVIYSADSRETVETELRNSEINLDNLDIDVKIYCKASAVDNDNYKNYSELAEQIAKDFMSSKKGILAGSIIQALSKLRDSSSLLLGDVLQEYDEALLYHRILLDTPDKTKDFLEELVKDEILSYLNQTDFRNAFWSSECMKKFYIANKSKIEFDIKKDEENKISTDDINSLIENGVGKKNSNFEKGIKSKIKSEIISLNKELTKKFSIYSMMIANHLQPNLKNGCVVSFDGKYLLCIQPLCDSERIPEKTSNLDIKPKRFLFLELQIKEKQPFDFYLDDNGIKAIKIDFANMKTYYFWGNKQGLVCIDGNKEFHAVSSNSSDNEVSLHYVSCLKPMVAQKFLNEFAAFATHTSRVGIDQFEWLRLKGCE